GGRRGRRDRSARGQRLAKRRGPDRDHQPGRPRRRPPGSLGPGTTAQGAASMAKKISGYVKLQVPAGSANPSPPIGPALGQRGLNIREFCKQCNAQTQKMEKGTPIPVIITAYQDRSFSFE